MNPPLDDDYHSISMWDLGANFEALQAVTKR
jgi:hypothetical protein